MIPMHGDEIRREALPPPQGAGAGSRFSRRTLLAGAAGVAGGALLQPVRAGAQTAEITVDRAKVDPIPIAIPNLVGVGGETAQLGRDMAAVITNNLARSGLFRAIDRAAFVSANPGDVPNFANWKVI